MYKVLEFIDKRGVTHYESAFVPVGENAFYYLLNLAKHFYGIVTDARLLNKKETDKYMEA